jgi:hypothetical protein
MIVYINYTNNTNNYTIFKNRLGRTLLVPNTSTSLQTTLAAAAYLASIIIIIIIIMVEIIL